MKAFAIAAILLLTAGCASFDPHNVIGRMGSTAPHTPVPAGSAGMLDDYTRRAAIDFVWNTVNERYVDPRLAGIDWRAARARHEPLILATRNDRDFWEALDRMTGELKDAHTRVHSPEQLRDQREYRSSTQGFSVREIGDGLYVSSVNPESDAWWAGVRQGMRVTRIDGEAALPRFRAALADTRDSSTPQARALRAVGRLMAGPAGSGAAYEFERFDGSSFRATLKRRVIAAPPSVTARVLPSGFGYLRLSGWVGSLTPRVLAGIAEMKDTPGLIIDLRNNGGGSADMVERVAREFFAGDQPTGTRLTRTGKPIDVAWGLYTLAPLESKLRGVGTAAYTKPLVVLVNEASGSASELFSAGLQDLGRARVVGTQTCGCLLAYFGYAEVPGGGGLAYSELAFRTVKGRAIEGVGVVPDVPVPLTVGDLRENRDRALEAAEEELRAAAAAKAGLSSAERPPG